MAFEAPEPTEGCSAPRRPHLQAAPLPAPRRWTRARWARVPFPLAQNLSRAAIWEAI